LYLLSVSLCLPASLGHAKKSNVSNSTVAAAAFAFAFQLLFAFASLLLLLYAGVVFCLFIWNRANQTAAAAPFNKSCTVAFYCCGNVSNFIYLSAAGELA